jgi:hypothetical protein
MSRAVRTARGAFGALAATLLAAASHSLAGGETTLLAVVATTMFAMPLCILLAGKFGSLWRLTLAVASSQFVYHWSFAGLGVAQGQGSTAAASGLASSPHASHLSAAQFLPELTAAGAADAWMWASHAVAAALTIALMHWGEHAAGQLLRVLRRALPATLPLAVCLPRRKAILALHTAGVAQKKQAFLSAISHRGPPATPAFTM